MKILKYTVFTLLGVLFLNSCSTEERVDNTNDVTFQKGGNSYSEIGGKFTSGEKSFIIREGNSLDYYIYGNLQYNVKHTISDSYTVEEYINTDGYAVTEYIADGLSGDRLKVIKKSDENGVYIFDLEDQNGRLSSNVQYQTIQSKSCGWCWVAGAGIGVISEIIEALDDTAAEDCGQAAEAGCGAGNVDRMSSSGAQDGGFFGTDIPAQCEFTCK